MEALNYPFNNSEIIANKRKLKKQLLAENGDYLEKRIAILGGSTTNEVKSILELFLLNEGIQPIFYESEYNHFYEDAMFDVPELAAFHPDIIYIFTTNRNIGRYPSISDSAEQVNALLDEQYDKFRSLWEHIREKYGCPVIQNNFEMPLYRLLGNRDCYDIHGALRFVHDLNSKLYNYAQENDWLNICDINYISADYGLKEWQNPKYWYMYKMPMPMDAVPDLAYNVCRIIKSIFGKNKKGIALDLDNTLWGGVIGEDGVSGIEIGNENAEAEAYLDFQRYLKKLQGIGVILCINSKNDYDNAISGLNHPDSVLREDDFIEIRANWDNKDENHRSIAKAIGILPESILFIDDNPVERDIVKKGIEGVAAPDIGSVDHYIQVIDRLGAFEKVSVSEDDTNRNQMYLENKKREQQRKGFTNYSDYLRSLEMEAEIVPFDAFYYGRISQLSNKSNQYNLTTKRYTKEEIQAVSENPDCITLQGRLADKFGDNGIVSLIIGKVEGSICSIDLWVMSCRVLKREMEFAMMDSLVGMCKGRGIATIRGVYLPTKKNAIAMEHYGRMGFEKTYEDSTETIWKLQTADYQKKNSVIKIKGL